MSSTDRANVSSSSSTPTGPAMPFEQRPSQPQQPTPGASLLWQVVDRLAALDRERIAPLGEAAFPRVIPMESRFPLAPGMLRPAMLSERLGRGSRHVAHGIHEHDRHGRLPSGWLGLIARDDAGWSLGSRHEGRLQRALGEHAHALILADAAPDLLPAYGGLSAVVASPRAAPDESNRIHFATVWERKDVTLAALVDDGGLAGGARLGGAPMSGRDVGRIMSLLGDAYGRLHQRRMAYTDPRLANIALGLDKRPRGGQAEAAGPRRERIRDLVFIDAESMQRPGYSDDPTIGLDRALSTKVASEDILAKAFLGMEAIKRAQSDPRNDVYHIAAMSFALVSGHVPQDEAVTSRMHARLRRDHGLSAGDHRRILFDETRLARREAGFDREIAALDEQTRVGRLPPGLGRLIGDGLLARVQTLAQWRGRLGESGFA